MFRKQRSLRRVKGKPMANEARDPWTKFDMIVKAMAALLLPIVILIASQWYTKQQKDAENARLAQQKAADEIQHKIDRVTTLLTQLASENTRQRLLALKFIEYLAQSHEFPEELLPALIGVVDDKDEEVADAAAHTLAQVITLNPNLAKSVEVSAQTNPGTKKIIDKALQRSPSLAPLIHATSGARDGVRGDTPIRDQGKPAVSPDPGAGRKRIESRRNQ